MYTLLLLLSVSFFVSSRGAPLQEPDRKGTDGSDGHLITAADKGEELPEDVDFEDYNDFDKWGLAEPSVNSVRHFHQKKGEILVPCFGMWWPVGGTYYDYIDYYGDGRKKRRRSRKRSKAAKAKRKKS